MSSTIEPFYKHFDEICKEDREEVKSVCTAAAMTIRQNFKYAFIDKDTNEFCPEVVAVIFSKTYDAILDELVNLEKKNSEFNINVCGRLDIGYSNIENEDDEKEGNFMIYIRHKNFSHVNSETNYDDPSPKELCVSWSTTNIKDQPEILKRIAANAVEKLKRVDVIFDTSDAILPIFITVYEHLVLFIQDQRAQANEFEYSINFASCFTIGARETDNGDEIYIIPSINSKLKLKSDANASAKNDN